MAEFFVLVILSFVAVDISITIGTNPTRAFCRRLSRSLISSIGRLNNRLIIRFEDDGSCEFLVVDLASEVDAIQMESSLLHSKDLILMEVSDSVVAMLHYANEVINTVHYDENYVHSFAHALGRYPNLISAPTRSPRIYLCLIKKSD